MIIFKRNIPKKYIFILILAVVIGLLVWSFGGSAPAKTVVVERATIVQEVSVTGKTKARSEVELGFDVGGRVAKSAYDVGAFVNKGSLIAELDITSDLATLAKEKASLAEAEANYSEQGKEIALAIMDAYSTADNAVRNKTDQFFKTPRQNPQFEVKFSDGNFTHYFNVPSDVSLELNSTRKSLEGMLDTWQAELPNINAENSGNLSNMAIQRMNTVSSFLDKVAYAVNSFAPSEYAYESTVSGYKTAIDSARSTVATAKEKISSISGDEARVAQSKSSIASLEAGFSKSKIVAPFSGTITRQDAKLGQIARAGEALVSMISESDMFIEANVSEINIAKVATGNKTQVEFDALPGEVFSGAVVFIDPAETLVDGVANYKIRVELDQFDERIRSGLTANINIETSVKEGVVSVPSYALIKEDNKYFVEKVEGEIIIKTEVQTGLLGRGGMIEVVSGLSPGEVIQFGL